MRNQKRQSRKRYHKRDENKEGLTFSCNPDNYDWIYETADKKVFGSHSRSILIDALIDYAITDVKNGVRRAVDHVDRVINPEKYHVIESEGHL